MQDQKKEKANLCETQVRSWGGSTIDRGEGVNLKEKTADIAICTLQHVIEDSWPTVHTCT